MYGSKICNECSEIDARSNFYRKYKIINYTNLKLYIYDGLIMILIIYLC